MKALVAYYLRTGNTKKVAEALAETLNADIEAIVSDMKDKGMARLAMQAFLRVRAKIAPTTSDAASYDMVVIGSPVWAGKMSSPIRTYLAQNKDKFTSVAFFCTHGQPGSEGSTRCSKAWKRFPGRKRRLCLTSQLTTWKAGSTLRRRSALRPRFWNYLLRHSQALEPTPGRLNTTLSNTPEMTSTTLLIVTTATSNVTMAYPGRGGQTIRPPPQKLAANSRRSARSNLPRVKTAAAKTNAPFIGRYARLSSPTKSP